MYCKKCGAVIADDAAFCPTCGTAQSSAETSDRTSGGTPAQTSTGNQTQKKGINIFTIIGFICVLPNILIMISGGSPGAIPLILGIVGIVLCFIGWKKAKE